MLTASDTAFSIAHVRALEGDRPPEERLFEDPYAAIFSAAGAHAAEGIRRFVEAPFFVENDTLPASLGRRVTRYAMPHAFL
jgi:O-methyltransferase involved in polyketide biosynthesis